MPNRRPLSRTLEAFGFGLLVLVTVPGCAPSLGGWEVTDLSEEQGSLPVVRDSRLSDSPPHMAPYGEGLVLFLCRWSVQQPIPVSLPPDADPRELRILRLALKAWSSAGIGVAFREVEPAEARLELRFVSAGPGSPTGSGNALADCAIATEGGRVVLREGRVPAEIRWASIYLNRQERDALGRPVALGDDQLLGTVLHELGHALGYAAHPVLGASIMQRTTDEVRKLGARVAGGAAFSDPNLSALYALPRGVVVGELKLSPAEVGLFARFDAEARAYGLEGPYSRVGDVRARYFYRGAGGVPFALRLSTWREDIVQPGRLGVEPNAAAAGLLKAGGN